MIDWARVGELVDEIGQEDFGEVVELFLAEVSTAITSLEEAGDNPVLIEERMHFLKGAALNLGFEALADICARGEKEAADNRATGALSQEVRSIYEQSCHSFQTELPGRLAA